MKIKFLRDTQLDNINHKEGDVAEVDAKRGKVLCECGICEEVKMAKPKKDGKK
jgi:hypothetical protein|tara:strand:+ start:114 stop:272 length:159 start_codon:yes stop_codon:yes gene_type:complete